MNQSTAISSSNVTDIAYYLSSRKDIDIQKAKPIGPIITGVITILVILAKSLLLFLLRKIQKLSWSARFYLGAIAVSDITTSLFMLAFQTIQYIGNINKSICKAVFVVGLTSEYMGPATSILINAQCLRILHASLENMLNMSSRFTVAGRVLGVLTASVAFHIMGVMLPVLLNKNAEGDVCIINQPNVYYQPFYRAHLGVILFEFGCNLILFILVAIKLRQRFDKSTKLTGTKTHRFDTQNSTQDSIENTIECKTAALQSTAVESKSHVRNCNEQSVQEESIVNGRTRQTANRRQNLEDKHNYQVNLIVLMAFLFFLSGTPQVCLHFMLLNCMLIALYAALFACFTFACLTLHILCHDTFSCKTEQPYIN